MLGNNVDRFKMHYSTVYSDLKRSIWFYGIAYAGLGRLDSTRLRKLRKINIYYGCIFTLLLFLIIDII
jgi:hypothetical protein